MTTIEADARDPGDDRTLYLDHEGDIWLCEGNSARCLGPAEGELFNDVPQSLWEPLIEAIGQRLDADVFGAACRADDERTYRRQQL